MRSLLSLQLYIVVYTQQTNNAFLGPISIL